MKKLKKLSMLLLMLFALLSMSAGAEAKTSKKTIKAVNSVVNSYFKAQKSNKPANMNKALLKPAIGKYGKTKLDSYLKAQNKKLYYKITSTKVKGNTATVKVKCKYYSAYNAYRYAIVYAADAFRRNPNLTDAQQNKLVNSYFLKFVKKYKPTKRTLTLTIPVVKYKGHWKVKGCTRSMLNTLYLDLYRAIDSLAK